MPMPELILPKALIKKIATADLPECRFPLRFDPGFPLRTDPA
jgi:hypothetical protein